MKTFIVQMSHGGYFKVKADECVHRLECYVFVKYNPAVNDASAFYTDIVVFSLDKVDCYYEKGAAVKVFGTKPKS